MFVGLLVVVSWLLICVVSALMGAFSLTGVTIATCLFLGELLKMV